MISLSGISKRFGAVAVLDGVSLAVASGRVHGLLGENGAGKSTLMNILFGLVQPDVGTIAVRGQVVRITSPQIAHRLGIGMVHQHFKLVPTLSVADNLALALGKGWGRIDRAAWHERIRTRASRLEWTIDPTELVETLSVGQQQRVEILKALLAITDGDGARTLILDEPTAVLTPQEVDDLLSAVRALAAEGVTIIYISHKLGEIARVCDEVSVLRRGRVVHHGTADEAPERLAEVMVGAAVTTRTRQPDPAPASAEVRLAMEWVSLVREGRTLLESASFTLRAGEIVGIAGVEGNGQVPLVQTLLGHQPPDTGRILRAVPGSRIAVIPDDRQREALIMPFDLTQNLLLRRYRERPFSVRGWLQPSSWTTHALSLMERHDVRAPAADAAMTTLSGGNQQKAVVARELDGDPAVIIAINPTRGLDVGAARAVLDRLVGARDRGAAILLIHSDLDELLTVSDRVLVLHDGRLSDSAWPACDRRTIGHLMMGAP